MDLLLETLRQFDDDNDKGDNENGNITDTTNLNPFNGLYWHVNTLPVRENIYMKFCDELYPITSEIYDMLSHKIVFYSKTLVLHFPSNWRMVNFIRRVYYNEHGFSYLDVMRHIHAFFSLKIRKTRRSRYELLNGDTMFESLVAYHDGYMVNMTYQWKENTSLNILAILP